MYIFIFKQLGLTIPPFTRKFALVIIFIRQCNFTNLLNKIFAIRRLCMLA